MHAFVVVASPLSNPARDAAVGLLEEESPRGVPFAAQQHVHWASDGDAVRFGGWSDDELVPSTAQTSDGGLVAVAGLPIRVGDARDAALVGADAIRAHVQTLAALTEQLDGTYAIVSLARDGSGTLLDDPFGLHPLYLGRHGSLTAIANRASLVAAVLARASGRPATPDEDAVAWLLLNGQMFGDATPYRGVTRLPFGSAAVLGRGGDVTVVPWHEPPWAQVHTRSAPFEQLVDSAEARMAATITAALAAAPGKTWSELTAGRDSRLVLELATRAGVADRLTFCTYGPSGSPDGRVASEIARVLGLRHEAGSWPALLGGPTLANLAEQVRTVSAQVPCWETTTPPDRPGITCSGLTGESLRTNYPRKAGLTSVEAAVEGFDSYRFGRYQYVRPDTVRALLVRARALFLAPAGAGVAPEDLFDVFYVQHRLRRWIGDKPDRFARTVFPLYSPFSTGIAMRSGWQARARASIHEAIARRAQLPIDHLAFEQGTRWRRDERTQRTSRPAAAPPSTERALIAQELIAMRQRAIRDAVEFDRANPAFEMVDREALLRDADCYADLDRRQQIELHHALTVVLWLGMCRPDRDDVND